MEAVSAVVEATVTAAWVDAVAVRRVRRVCLNPVAAEKGEGEQNRDGARSENQRHVRERVTTAPP
jgi:hypothetical protein